MSYEKIPSGAPWNLFPAPGQYQSHPGVTVDVPEIPQYEMYPEGDDMAVFNWFHTTGATSTNDRWLQPWTWGTQTGTDIRRLIAPTPMALDRLYVRQGTAGSNEANNVYVVQVNGVDTALTVTVANDSTTLVSNTTDAINVSAGDEIGLRTAHSVVVATACQDVLVGCRGRSI